MKNNFNPYVSFLKPVLDFLLALTGFIILSPQLLIVILFINIANNGKPLYITMQELMLNNEKRNYLSQNARTHIASRFDQKVVWEALLNEYKTQIRRLAN